MAQGRKAGYKKVRSKNTSDKGEKRTKSIKRSIILSISSTALTKLKSLIKFKNQPEVQLGQNLGPKPPKPEPQLQPSELIKQSQQVSKVMVATLCLTKSMKNYIS